MAKLIKVAEKQPAAKSYRIGQVIKFPVRVPLQNIGTQTVHRVAKISKINRKTVQAVDKHGNTWSIDMDEIVIIRNFSDVDL